MYVREYKTKGRMAGDGLFEGVTSESRGLNRESMPHSEPWCGVFATLLLPVFFKAVFHMYKNHKKTIC